MMAALPSAFRSRSLTMSKKTKTTKTAKADQQSMQIKEEAKGRFWVVPKDGGQEHGPYDSKKAATDAKAALASGATPAPAAEEAKPAKAKQVKEPKAKRASAIDAAAQVLAGSKEPMNCMSLVEAMATQGLWSSPNGNLLDAPQVGNVVGTKELVGCPFFPRIEAPFMGAHEVLA